MKRFCRAAACALIAVMLVAMSAALYMQVTLPADSLVVAGEDIHFDYPVSMVKAEGTAQPEVYNSPGNSYKVDIKLAGAIQIKTVEINVVDRKMVMVSGEPMGIKMFTDGLMVVGASDVVSGGQRVNPAKAAGIQVGDILLAFNGAKLNGNEGLASMMEKNGGSPITFTVQRGESTFAATVTPALSDGDQKYRLGVWVRDSSAGIGTMTYYDLNSGLFAGLGHAVCDVDTGDIMPLSGGEIVSAEVTGCRKGENGSPGELKGRFISGETVGTLLANTSSGVYGTVRSRNIMAGEQMPVALRHEVRAGKATIRTTIEGTDVQEYEIEIEKVTLADYTKGQNMVIRITDPELLEKTGGIVQGMSGSPILQNGMLVGAVTHVFVNDPTRGFGIFAENIDAGAQTTLNRVRAIA